MPNNWTKKKTTADSSSSSTRQLHTSVSAPASLSRNFRTLQISPAARTPPLRSQEESRPVIQLGRSASERHSYENQTSLPRGRKSGPGADRAIRICPSGIALLNPSVFQALSLMYIIGPDFQTMPFLDSRLRDRVVSIYNNSSWCDGYPIDAQGGEFVDCQIQPPAGEEKVYEARCLRRSEAVVCLWLPIPFLRWLEWRL